MMTYLRRIILIAYAFSVLCILAFSPVCAAAPVTSFTGTPVSGTGPLTVQFTDSSTNTPTGWAWFFGDETYTGTWTKINASSGWVVRSSHSSVVLPDGSIVLTGGYDGAGWRNDTWRSTDGGISWTLLSGSSVWPARSSHASVVLPNGHIILTGGNIDGVNFLNDTWRSTDGGATWTPMNLDSGWGKRDTHSMVVMPDGMIVLMGGYNGLQLNDTWGSFDEGATWGKVTGGAEWTARECFRSVVVSDGSIVLMGGADTGHYFNDVWRSTDSGATWTRVTPAAGWSARTGFGSVVMPDGSIVLTGGGTGTNTNDVWRSTDNGATWTQVNPAAGWSVRTWHGSVTMPDGSIVVMGGTDGAGTYYNDTWRLNPVGSSLQNPQHTYNGVGVYRVALQAFNTGGFNRLIKNSYITVATAGAPGTDFTGTPTTGPPPLTVQFTDTSTQTPTAWQWTFGDGTTSILQNPAHTYNFAGTYDVSLNATNAAGSVTRTRGMYITVTTLAGGGSGGGDAGGVDSGAAAAAPAAEAAPAPQAQEAVQEQEAPAPQAQEAVQEQEAPAAAPAAAAVEGLAGVTVAASYPAGYDGLSLSGNAVSIDLAAAQQAGAVVTVFDDHIESYQSRSPGVTITFWGNQFQTKGGKITGNVSRAEIKTDPLVVNVSSGKVAGSMQAVLLSIDKPTVLENTITGNISQATLDSYNTLLARENQQVAGIAYLMRFRRGNLTSTGAANVTMTVPASWVDRHGGKDAVRITRTSDGTGQTELLATTFTGTDAGGNMVFRGDSPRGTSLFGLVTAQASAAQQQAHPNETFVPAQKPAVGTSVGMAGWMLDLLWNNPVLLGIIIVVLAAMLFFGWWRRRL